MYFGGFVLARAVLTNFNEERVPSPQKKMQGRRTDSTLAGELLAEYGSLTGLARASLANLRRFLPQTKAARLVAALRLGTLACKDPLTQEHFDCSDANYASLFQACWKSFACSLWSLRKAASIVRLTDYAFLSPPSRDRGNHSNSISVGASWNEHRPECVPRTEDMPLPKGQNRCWQNIIYRFNHW